MTGAGRPACPTGAVLGSGWARLRDAGRRAQQRRPASRARFVLSLLVGFVATLLAAGLAAGIPGPLTANPKTRTRAWQQRKQAIAQHMQHLDILRRWMD